MLEYLRFASLTLYKSDRDIIPTEEQNQTSYIDDLVQDYSISIADTLEILQSCTKPSFQFLLCVFGIDVFGDLSNGPISYALWIVIMAVISGGKSVVVLYVCEIAVINSF